jgi:hypothetical protein
VTRDSVAAQLRGLGVIGLLAVAVILAGNVIFIPLSAILILAWAWLSRTGWREIGLGRPNSWTRTILLGIGFGCALKLFMKAVVMPLLGAPPVNQAFQFLAGNTAALPGIIFAVTVGAGFGEELLFRGYAFERLHKLIGRSRAATIAIVLITSAWFGYEHHAFQGVPGVQQATIVGLLVGAIYAQTQRLWFLIVTHAAFDLTAVALIYWGLEERVARSIYG